MVIVRNDVDVTLNNTQNMDIEDIVDEDELNQKFNEFEQLDNVSLSYYEEVKFAKVITSSNQTNINSVTTSGDYFLLLGQTTTTENGFYYQQSTTSSVKQSTPTVNTVYYNNTNMGLFSTTLAKFIVSYSRRIFLYKTFTSDTQQTVYNIPHFSSTPITVNLDLIGANDTSFTDNISVENTQRFFNNGSSIISMGDYGSNITRTNNTFSTTPTITYDTTSVADTITLKITPNATGGTFYVRTVATF